MIKATQLKKGMTIIKDNDLYKIVSTMHITPGNWRGMVQTKLKSLKNGSIIEHRFRSEDIIERAILNEVEMEYIYSDGTDYHFLNTKTYEQIHISEEMLGDAVRFLVPNTMLQVEFYEGTPVGIELPITVDLKVVETPPGIKGATASQQRKPARLETGLIVQVPSFIEEGEVIRVSTVEGTYIERVSAK
ncbi:MAG: elongation factor P [Acidobacteriota bacterium]